MRSIKPGAPAPEQRPRCARDAIAPGCVALDLVDIHRDSTYNLYLLTLGMHAQQGLQYSAGSILCVCVSVCLPVTMLVKVLR